MKNQYTIFTFIAVFIFLLPSLSIAAYIPNDDISIIRERVLRLMIWPTEENISITIQNALLYVQTLNSSCYWPDVNYTDQHVHWLTAEHMTRITVMLQAWTINGSTVKNDTKLLSSIHCALNLWLTKDFKHKFWWYNKIGIPLEANKQLLMLGDDATNFEQEKIIEISYRSDWWNGGSVPVGRVANSRFSNGVYESSNGVLLRYIPI